MDYPISFFGFARFFFSKVSHDLKGVPSLSTAIFATFSAEKAHRTHFSIFHSTLDYIVFQPRNLFHKFDVAWPVRILSA